MPRASQLKASLKLKSSTTKAAKNVKLFNVKTILKDSGSSVVDTSFDMADLDAQQKAKLKTNIENLILKDASWWITKMLN